MSFEIRPLTPQIGAEVVGLDLSRRLSSSALEALRATWIERTILLFRDQDLTPSQQVRFTRRLGEVSVYTQSRVAHPEHPEILVLSNLELGGRLIGTPNSGRYWHTDGHFLECPPAGSFLVAKQVPPSGGATSFANMFAAYEALPASWKERIASWRIVISRVQSWPINYPEKPPLTERQKAAWPDVTQPAVRVHPESGLWALYVGGQVPWRVEGLHFTESAPWIHALQRFSVRRQFTYTHEWQPGDAILWDNRSSLHAASGFDAHRHARLMHRTSIAGDRPFGPTDPQAGPSGSAR